LNYAEAADWKWKTPMSERRGFWSPLADPTAYEAFHHIIGARRWLKQFARDVINAPQRAQLLDIGCGPGSLLNYLPDVEYFGFDRNAAYIEKAKHTFGSRGIFICDDVGNFAQHALPPVDIAVAIGLLHHLDDALAAHMLLDIRKAIKPGGRLITADPCFHPAQSAVQRFVISHDRGMHVRPFEQYVALCGLAFAATAARFSKGYSPFPYSICIVQASQPR
jgi:SAM-dependent methyltransferase